MRDGSISEQSDQPTHAVSGGIYVLYAPMRIRMHDRVGTQTVNTIVEMGEKDRIPSGSGTMIYDDLSLWPWCFIPATSCFKQIIYAKK